MFENTKEIKRTKLIVEATVIVFLSISWDIEIGFIVTNCNSY
jgi:hypothetical protein